jgi:hypothetical protein
MSTAVEPARPWHRLQRQALIAGVVGLIACGLGALVSPAHFFRAYLVAFNFWLGIALGCLVVLMIQHLTGGAWGILLRRVLEAGTRTLLPLAVSAVPLLFGLQSLYLWARPEEVAHDEDLQEKSRYLNVPFFVVRLVVCFVVWLLLAARFNRLSSSQDAGTTAAADRRFRILIGPGLVLYAGTVTFASIDWVMSLEPHWASTIFPMLFAVGQALEGLAFAVAVLVLLATRPPLSTVVQRSHLRDLGNLLLTFVMFWAYMSFSQLLLIWAENMPEETPWYLRRLRGGWEWVALMLLLFQFALPFFLLLFRDVKEHPRRLAAVALFILAMRFVDILWWVEAAFPGGISFYWLMDAAALVGLGGVWLWWFLWCLGTTPLLPLHDPDMPTYLPEAVRHA